MTAKLLQQFLTEQSLITAGYSKGGIHDNGLEIAPNWLNDDRIEVIQTQLDQRKWWAPRPSRYITVVIYATIPLTSQYIIVPLLISDLSLDDQPLMATRTGKYTGDNTKFLLFLLSSPVQEITTLGRHKNCHPLSS